MTKDIDALVKEKISQKARSPITGDNGVTSNFQPDNWDFLKNKVLYTIAITVKGGRMSIKLDPNHLGLSLDVINELEQIATGGYSARISKLHKEAMNKLQSMQKTLYGRYTVFADPFRFIIDSDLSEAMEEIEKIKTEAEKYRSLLHDSYEDELQDFLKSVATVIDKTAIDAIKRTAALKHYADAYPTQDEFKNESLKLIVEGPTKINSLMDQISADTSATKKERDILDETISKAENDPKIQQEKEKLEKHRNTLASIERSQKDYASLLEKAVTSAHERAKDEAYSNVADIVDRCAVIDPGKPDCHVQKSWETSFNRLETLAAFDSKINSMFEKAKEIREIFTSKDVNVSKDTINEKLLHFHDFLKNLIQNESGEGAQKLMNSIALDREYKEIIGKLETIEKAPNPEELRLLQGKCESLANFFRYRHKTLERAFNQAKKSVRIHLGYEKPDEEKKPFDLEAGF